MIEQKIEKMIVDKITSIFTDNGIDDFRVYGSLQPDILKGIEDVSSIVVVVKANPRSYQSPTIPTCQIDFEVQLTLRADIDYGFAEADTTYGKVGVKCWIYKGEVLPEKKEGGNK